MYLIASHNLILIKLDETIFGVVFFVVCTIGVGCVLSMNCKEEEKASSKNENDIEGKHVAIDIHGNLEEKDLQKVTCKSIEKNFMEDIPTVN